MSFWFASFLLSFFTACWDLDDSLGISPSSCSPSVGASFWMTLKNTVFEGYRKLPLGHVTAFGSNASLCRYCFLNLNCSFLLLLFHLSCYNSLCGCGVDKAVCWTRVDYYTKSLFLLFLQSVVSCFWRIAKEGQKTQSTEGLGCLRRIYHRYLWKYSTNGH